MKRTFLIAAKKPERFVMHTTKRSHYEKAASWTLEIRKSPFSNCFVFTDDMILTFIFLNFTHFFLTTKVSLPFLKKQFIKKMFVEVDGEIHREDKTGVSSTILQALQRRSSKNVDTSTEYRKCKKWIKISLIDEIFFEENMFEIVRFTPQAPQPVPFFHGDDEVFALPEQVLEEVVRYAPKGWWINYSVSNVTFTYHVKDESIITQILSNKPPLSDVAQAINRLADEIALKPATEDGNEFKEAYSRFYGNASEQ